MGNCWEERKIGTPGLCDHLNKMSVWCGYSGKREGIIFNTETHGFKDASAPPPPVPAPRPVAPPPVMGSSGGQRKTKVTKTEAETRKTHTAAAKRNLGTGKKALTGRYANMKWLQDLNQTPAEPPFIITQNIQTMLI